MIGERPKPPFDIHAHGRKLVRRAVQIDGQLCDAIMDAAMGSQAFWEPSAIKALNDKLDACDMTVAEWLTSLPQ